MAVAGAKPLVFGFMTVRETDGGGHRGAYLLTNDHGRPLEFLYTNELRITKAQRVLFGARFEPHLCAEVMGRPLTDRQSIAPKIILVDRSPLLELRRSIPAPVVLLEMEAAENALVARAHGDFPSDVAAFERVRELAPASFDWREPFDRLVQALAEIRDPSLPLAG